MSSTTLASGTAAKWGPLWGARPRDWAENEDQQRPAYAAVLDRVPAGPGDRVLDIGCGTGAFLRMVADRGARPFGLDASEALLDVARRRVPEGQFSAGDMEALPYEDHEFDVVTGFNAFFFAGDLVHALREAGRVARRGAPVVIQVWGPPEQCDLEAMKRVARRYAPAPPRGAPAPPPLWRAGVLEALARQAGLRPEEAFDVRYAFEYPDAGTLGRLLLAPMGLAVLAGPEREDAVRREIVEALAPFRAADGAYRLTNAFRVLVTRA